MNWANALAAVAFGAIQLLQGSHALAQVAPSPDLDEARRAAAVAAETASSSTNASSVVHGYTESPPELGLYGSSPEALNAAAQERTAQCAERPDDPACTGALSGRNANRTPRITLSPEDQASVAGAKRTTRNPTGAVGSLSSYYSGCTEEGVCDSSVFCFGTRCFDKSAPPDQDFNAAMSYLEAGREAGTYIDPDRMTVFDGEASRCREDLLNLKNCCAANGKGQGMNNNGTFGVGSTLVFDILMNSGNRRFVMAGIKALATNAGYGSISNSLSLYGVSFTANPVLASAGQPVLAAGDGFVITVDPLTVAVTVFVTVALEMMSCEEDDMKTGMKEGAGLCVTLEPQRRCVRRVLGICTRRETTKCCFNSKLARIINQQGRQQLGLDWGSAASPRCTGFSIAQLERLDFSAMDLSEFYASLVPPSTGEPDVWAEAAQNKVSDCYYGEGKCVPTPPPEPALP